MASKTDDLILARLTIHALDRAMKAADAVERERPGTGFIVRLEDRPEVVDIVTNSGRRTIRYQVPQITVDILGEHEGAPFETEVWFGGSLPMSSMIREIREQIERVLSSPLTR